MFPELDEELEQVMISEVTAPCAPPKATAPAPKLNVRFVPFAAITKSSPFDTVRIGAVAVPETVTVGRQRTSKDSTPRDRNRRRVDGF